MVYTIHFMLTESAASLKDSFNSSSRFQLSRIASTKNRNGNSGGNVLWNFEINFPTIKQTQYKQMLYM